MFRSPIVLFVLAALAAAPFVVQAQEDRKAEYVRAVVRGAGLMPWQEPGVSEAEREFRAMIEARKDELIARARPAHPAYYSADAIARAKENVANHEWARNWLAGQVARADEVAGMPAGWIEQMIPLEAPSHAYGFTCPACVGEQSQEGVGDPLVGWNYRNPEQFSCRACGTVFPNEAYPETQVLRLPRTGHEVHYYLNPEEQANPDDRSGKLAWHWVGYPIHNSFTGIIRERKVSFMRDAVQSLGIAYLFTREPRYAIATRDILVRLAVCYRQWPYRDYWDTYADCDPLYAAWHDRELPIEWKRHLSENAYARDTMDAARMLQNYWGAGRFHPSTDSVSGLTGVVQAYDFTANARDAEGKPIWDDASRERVLRDLFLEWIMGAEPYIGGPGRADEKNNKAPRIYNAMAALGKCLGIPEYAEVALRGYERVRDASFLYDGLSTESPSYTNMYLAQLLIVPESLHGYTWPDGFPGRGGTVDLYAQDSQLRMMYRAVLDTVLPDGTYLPLSDTRLNSKPSAHILQMGARHYPEIYAGALPNIHRRAGDEYAIFNLSDGELNEEKPLPLNEIYFPAWKTAILRHGAGADTDTLTLAFNPPGGHRHYDNLALFYADGDQTIVGDHGYLGDMPVNRWIKATSSHNLVIVDGAEQEFSARATSFEFMATSPLASVVEASSTAYPQCGEYRRRVALVKHGAHETFAIDLFSVQGGSEHRFRAYSEIAASDAADGRIEFRGGSLPPEAPLPDVGASLAEADIYGLRDVRSGAPEGDAWDATWSQADAAYRLWMVAQCDAVEAANGPGQRTHDETGRRVRYVDAVRRGDAGLASRFLAVHASRKGDQAFPVTAVERIATNAGPEAAALRIDTNTGAYYALHDFAETGEVDGIRFQGRFALVFRPAAGAAQCLAVEAALLEVDGAAIADGTPVWRTGVAIESEAAYQAAAAPPADWRFSPGPARAYGRVRIGGDWTGFPIDRINGDRVLVDRFPAQAADALEVPAVAYVGAGK